MPEHYVYFSSESRALDRIVKTKETDVEKMAAILVEEGLLLEGFERFMDLCRLYSDEILSNTITARKLKEEFERQLTD